MKRGRILFGGLCVVLSIGIIIESYRLRLGTLKEPGAGLWPFAVGLFFVCFSLGYLIKALNAFPSGAPPFWGGVKWKKPLLAMFILLLYPVLLEKMGFIFTTSLVMAILFRASDLSCARRPLLSCKAKLFPAAIALSIYARSLFLRK